MMTGPSGCGKTDATFKAAEYLGREVHYFNLEQHKILEVL